MVNPPGRTGYTRWSSKKKADEGFSVKAAGGGVMWAAVMALALALVASGVVYVTSLDERILSWVVDVGSFVILGLSSFITARRQARYDWAARHRRCVMWHLRSAAYCSSVSGFGVPKRLGFSLFAGAIGGILGVNS